VREGREEAGGCAVEWACHELQVQGFLFLPPPPSLVTMAAISLEGEKTL
jgi:hypothetical protein